MNRLAFSIGLLHLVLVQQICVAKPKGEILGRVESRELNEISGIAASRVNPDVVWLHNDGRTNQLFGVRTSGETMAIASGPTRWWIFEDIAMGPGPTPDQDYLYLGDIGDNDSRRPQVRSLPNQNQSFNNRTSQNTFPHKSEDFRFTYPDGPVDAEALLVDPQNGDIYIVSKENNHARVFYASAAEMKPQMPILLTEVAKLKVDNISAGDISRDGRWILFRNEKEGWLWSRDPLRESEKHFLRRPPPKYPYVRNPKLKMVRQLLSSRRYGYFTVSEGNRQPLASFVLPSNH